jgi:hypothetical protein
MRVCIGRFDPKLMKPSMGIDYLLRSSPTPLAATTRSIAADIFDPGNLVQPYHSINTDIHKRIRYIDAAD